MLPITPMNARNKLYEIESGVNEIVDVSFRQGIHEGINLLLEVIGDGQAAVGRKTQYMCLEMESRRKEVRGSGRSGWIYKIVRVVREYTNESEADQDLAGLKSGEITERTRKKGYRLIKTG